MKKLLFLIMPALLLFAGCQYDDTEVWKEVERQKGLITDLTQKYENLNSEIGILRGLIDKAGSGVNVKSVKQTADGYQIVFTDGSHIDIKNGAPGQDGTSPDAPVVSVKADEDGLYYWTVNGEWVLDASGNKLPVAGENGVTPLIKYEDPDWMVSYDNGENWEAIPGAEGIGTGITVTTDEENAYFTLSDGTVITIPLQAAAAKLQLVFDEKAFAVIAPGETATADYEIVAPKDAKTTVETFEQAGWTVEVTPKTETTGTIAITAPAAYDLAKVLFCLRTEEGQSFVKIITISAVSLNPFEAEYVVDATAGTLTLPAGSNVVITGAEGWITATPGEDAITVEVTENDTYEERSATLTITTKTGEYTTVIKQLQNDAIVLSGSTIPVTAEGGEIEIPVKANVEYTAEVTEGAEWLTDLKTKALVEKVWVATAAANEGEARTAKVTFTDGTISQVVEIAQAAPAAEPTLLKVALPEGLMTRNTYPVFTKDGSKAYIVTQGSGRHLIQIDVEKGEIIWDKDLGGAKTDNGGMMLVNPANDDVICANDATVFAYTVAGEKKWEFGIQTEYSKNTCNALMGSGPTISNDFKTIFAATQDYMLYAINAETGAKVAEYEIETEGTIYQYATYGDNNLILLAQGGGAQKGVRALHFTGSAFEELWVNGDIGIGLSDITSPVISKDHRIAYFAGGGNFNRVFLTDDYGFQLTGTQNGNNWNTLMAPDGYMYCASAANSKIIQIDPAKLPDGAAINPLSFSTSGDNELNFQAIAADTESNIYFYHNASHKVCKLNPATNTVETVYELDASIADYQAVFQFVGNKLVFGCHDIYILTIDAQRAEGWSGAGGDICCTRNATVVWGPAPAPVEPAE